MHSRMSDRASILSSSDISEDDFKSEPDSESSIPEIVIPAGDIDDLDDWSP